MASIANDPNGRRRISFVDASGKRRSVRLGKDDRRHAEMVRARIEALVSAASTRSAVDRETAAWVADLDGPLRDRLARVRLVKPRAGRTIGEWTKEYIESRGLKPESRRKLEQTKAKLLLVFPANTPLHELTPDGAATWRASLSGLSDAAAKTHVGNAKSMLGEAVRRDLITRNPFAALKGGTTAASDPVYVSREDIAKLIDAEPDPQWRVLIGLARYAGLRIPSESQGLTWNDVDFANARLSVKSPKTERFAGKDRRTVPIIPELMALLQAAFDAAPDGETHIVTIRGAGARRRRMTAMAERAKVSMWPDCWQTLRRCADIDFSRDFPAFAAAHWLGHSVGVSAKHYTTVVPDELFTKAACLRAARNPAQQAPELDGKGAQAARDASGDATGDNAKNSKKSTDFQQDALACASVTSDDNKWSRGESNPRA
jgi:integrase